MALPPEDEPTRRLPPTRPAEPLAEREVVRTEVDPAWMQAIHDRVRSLRSAVALLTLLSLAALGVGIWALLTQEEEGDARRGASQQRVQELEDRVDAMENQLQDAPTQNSVERLRAQQQQLQERVRAVEDQANDGGVEQVRSDVRQLSGSVDQMGQAIDELDRRVGDLEEQQQSQDSASP